MSLKIGVSFFLLLVSFHPEKSKLTIQEPFYFFAFHFVVT